MNYSPWMHPWSPFAYRNTWDNNGYSVFRNQVRSLQLGIYSVLAVSFRKVYSLLFLILPLLSFRWVGRFHLQLADCDLWVREHCGISYPLGCHTDPMAGPEKTQPWNLLHTFPYRELQVGQEDMQWPLLGKRNLKLFDEYFTQLWFTKMSIISFQ